MTHALARIADALERLVAVEERREARTRKVTSSTPVLDEVGVLRATRAREAAAAVLHRRGHGRRVK